MAALVFIGFLAAFAFLLLMGRLLNRRPDLAEWLESACNIVMPIGVVVLFGADIVGLPDEVGSAGFIVGVSALAVWFGIAADRAITGVRENRRLQRTRR